MYVCARAYEQKASVHLKIIAHIFLSIEKIVLDAAGSGASHSYV